MCKLASLFSVILIFTLAKHVSSMPTLFNDMCGDTGNYTQTDTYQTNLDLLLSDLVNHASNTSFYSSTAGEAGIDKAYAFFYCRGDIGSEDCHDCVQAAALESSIYCPSQKEVIMSYFQCTLRYANRSITFSQDEDLWSYANSPVNVSNPDMLEQTVSRTINSLISQAAYNSTIPGFAIGVANYSSSNVYFLVQCTPDIVGNSCEKCLVGALQNAARERGTKAEYIMYPNCEFMYDFDYFLYNSSSSTPALPPPRKGKKSFVLSSIIALPTAAVVSLLCGMSIVYFLDINKPKKDSAASGPDEVYISGVSYLSNSSRAPGVSDISESSRVPLGVPDLGEVYQMDNSGPRQFDFGVIRGATSNFSRANELGRGGFGVVYKGALPNGVEIAVKRLSANSGQGGKEFKTEVLLVGRLHHRNLVRLLGFSDEGEERLLIYELVPNFSLDRFLSDANLRSTLRWEERYKIIAGISRGLQYLHEDSQLKIVHRDLKPSNILLDKELNPKIADFGMAKLFNLDQTQANTTKVVGTIGYMAPEYVMTGKFSVKSDVYSFGVIILEIISGQLKSLSHQHSPFTSEGLLHHAWRLWQRGAGQELVDPTLGNNFIRIQAGRCIHIALLCVQEAPARRPTMSLVFSMLSSSEIELPPPSPPASFAYEIY